VSKKIAILGSTGSIGTSTLQVMDHLGEGYQVSALVAHSNIDVLEAQIKKYQPKYIAVYDEKAAKKLKERLPAQKILQGPEGIIEAAAASDADIVVSAIAGTLGLAPTIAAIQAGKSIALANKEALVSGGRYVVELAQSKGVSLIPVDSEHSALFQCLQGNRHQDIRRLILTASGGPFRSHSLEQLQAITPEQALKHPNWSMGPKVTIDSSTLMNKGLELIEAYWLFRVPLERIEVVIHPQSVIHSMVEYCDGSMLAQMSEPSMLIPIQYALTYPARKEGILKPFDFIRYQKLEFSYPDYSKFRALALAIEAIKKGQSYSCFMNAANEVLVGRFLNGDFGWLQIAEKLETLMDRHAPQPLHSLEEILTVDNMARAQAALI
jgi:1-deoxy-D-xylulose-5-phosphate reductoisomerase